MDKINFKLVFDRGSTTMTRYVMAETADEAWQIGKSIASELCEEGLDTVLLSVYDQAEDAYYL